MSTTIRPYQESKNLTKSDPRAEVMFFKVAFDGSVTHEELLRTIALPRPWEAARQRLMHVLQRPSLETKQRAWAWLKKWRSQIAGRTCEELPPPQIFSNEEGMVEFEWHGEGRHLVLTVPIDDSKFEWSKWDEGSGHEDEGLAGIGEVCDLLRWYLDA